MKFPCYKQQCFEMNKYFDPIVVLFVLISNIFVSTVQVGVNDVIKLCEMDFRESGNSGKHAKATENKRSITSKTSTGHMIGSSVEVKASKTSGGSNEISVRLEQELDESSQSSSDKFTLKDEKMDAAAVNCSGKVFLKKKNMEPKLKKTVLRLPQISTCRVGRDR